MEILLNTNRYSREEELVHLLKKKMDGDEKIVRKTLVKVWTKLLEKYARPGVRVPSEEEIRKELLDKGVDAAVSAVLDEHWFVFSFMIHDEIYRKVERGLARFNLAGFLEDVQIAQHDPAMLERLREKIRNSVMSEDF